MKKPLRFHWSMSSAGSHLKGAKARKDYDGVPNMEAHVEFCKHAEACGIDLLLTAMGFHRADPIAIAAALGAQTDTAAFLVATRSGIASPTLFVQQINSVSALTNGRVAINLVAGHSPKEFKYYGDFLPPDQRYDRTDEFLTVCRQFWESDEPVNFKGQYYQVKAGVLNTPFVSPNRNGPEIFMGGKSQRAFELAAKHATCLLTLPEAPEKLQPRIADLVAGGTEVGLLISIIARPSRGEALHAASDLIAPLGEKALNTHKAFKAGSVSEAFNSTLDLGERSEDWLTPWLWTGAVPYLGAPSIAFVGSYAEVAQGMMAFKSIGVSQFLLMGWPDMEEMTHFANGVAPEVRKLESQVIVQPQ